MHLYIVTERQSCYILLEPILAHDKICHFYSIASKIENVEFLAIDKANLAFVTSYQKTFEAFSVMI